MLIVLLAGMAAVDPGDVVRVGPGRLLFLDDAAIASTINVTRTVHQARKSPENPVLWPQEPWEGTVAIVYGSVLRDGDRFRMWYHNGQGVGYAESADGITWTRPGLGFFAVDGTDTNTLIRRGAEPGEPNFLPHYYELFGVHKDPGADPARRYVMGYLSIQRNYDGPRQDPFHGGQRRGLGVGFSPDGLHWTLGESWATEAICDGGTHWMFDPKTGRYVLYGRTKFVSGEVKTAWAGDDWVEKYFWGRSVARAESPDFLEWDHVDPATAPVVMTVDVRDTPGDEIYSMQVFPYEGVYIGLVQVFHNQADTCHLDIQLAVSHDGIGFTRVGGRTPFISCGGVGAWDRFNTSVANNPPIRVGDELRFYFSGRTYRHGPYFGTDKGEPGGGIGFATIPVDRFVSLGASFDGGEIVTKPLALERNELHINAISSFGEIIVEAAQNGKTVATSKPIHADGLDILVEWEQGTLDHAAGPVTLRLTLKNARLFGLW